MTGKTENVLQFRAPRRKRRPRAPGESSFAGLGVDAFEPIPFTAEVQAKLAALADRWQTEQPLMSFYDFAVRNGMLPEIASLELRLEQDGNRTAIDALHETPPPPVPTVKLPPGTEWLFKKGPTNFSATVPEQLWIDSIWAAVQTVDAPDYRSGRAPAVTQPVQFPDGRIAPSLQISPGIQRAWAKDSRDVRIERLANMYAAKILPGPSTKNSVFADKLMKATVLGVSIAASLFMGPLAGGTAVETGAQTIATTSAETTAATSGAATTAATGAGAGAATTAATTAGAAASIATQVKEHIPDVLDAVNTVEAVNAIKNGEAPPPPVDLTGSSFTDYAQAIASNYLERELAKQQTELTAAEQAELERQLREQVLALQNRTAANYAAVGGGAAQPVGVAPEVLAAGASASQAAALPWLAGIGLLFFVLGNR